MMMSDSGRVPDGTGLSSATEPASSLGPSGFDPSRVAEAAAVVARTQWGWMGQSLSRWSLNNHPDGRVWRSSVIVSNRIWHKLERLGLVSGRCDASTLTPFGRAVRQYLRDSDGSGEASETREAGLDPKGDSAGPKDIAQTPSGHPQ